MVRISFFSSGFPEEKQEAARERQEREKRGWGVPGYSQVRGKTHLTVFMTLIPA
jgi:hypothetical protein